MSQVPTTRPDRAQCRRPIRPGLRRRAGLLRALVVGCLLAAIAVASAAAPATAAAQATAALGRPATAPDDPSEAPGTGYLLTDPSQPGAKTEWAGAYNTLPGVKSYCIDHSYNYPRRQFGYLTEDASGWAARRGSSPGAAGHLARRVSWILNSYGQSNSRSVTAAVSMAINLVVDPAGFGSLYRDYYLPQLLAVDPIAVRDVARMVAESDRFAGPYTTRVVFAAAPAVEGTGSFSVSIRSAHGYALPDAAFVVTTTRGMSELSATRGTTGRTGVARLSFHADRPGTLTVTARGMAPATTVTLGYSPSHDASDFTAGSQRVVAVAAVSVSPTPAGTGAVSVARPQLHTDVVGGTGRRSTGHEVRDEVAASGLAPNQRFRVEGWLSDQNRKLCGSVSTTVRTDAFGAAHAVTSPIAVCGTGFDTFTEVIVDAAGQALATSPPGQPCETFPVARAVPATSVRPSAGVAARPGTPLAAQTPHAAAAHRPEAATRLALTGSSQSRLANFAVLLLVAGLVAHALSLLSGRFRP